MLEAEAHRIECQLDFEPPVFDMEDHSFRPRAECAVCDEPTEVVYYCQHCLTFGDLVPLCPNCVSGSLALIEAGVSRKNLENMALHPECPGACSAYYPL